MRPVTFRRTALAALAAGSLVALAACGGTTQAASSGASAAPSGSAGGKTIVFSPLGLQIPAMKTLSEGVQAYAESKGYTVVVQDPKLDSQKQVTDLQASVESGSAAGAWVITLAPDSMRSLVTIAGDKKVPMLISGSPSEYGLGGLTPGLSYSAIDYAGEGKDNGEQLAQCINERYDGKGKVLFMQSQPGTAGKEELESAFNAAFKAAAPNAEIVSTITVTDRTAAQTDAGNAIQGNPDINAVFGQNDEGGLGAIGAFKAAGKDLPCLTESGGNDEALAAVKSGEIYAVIAEDFEADMKQSFDQLVTMIEDPTAQGVQLTVPHHVVKAQG